MPYADVERRRSYIAEKSREYRSIPGWSAARNAAYRAKNPEKNKARAAVANALRRGKLAKQPCRCGETKVQAHHADYSKPLEVTWLCHACHVEEHRHD